MTSFELLCCTCLHATYHTQVAQAVQQLCKRLERDKKGSLSAKEALVLRLNQQYPDDVGVLAAFFLNLVTLKAGQVLPAAELSLIMQRSRRPLCYNAT